MNVEGAWVGSIRGTNVGGIIFYLAQQDAAITGVARLNDFQYGTALYSVTGQVSDDVRLNLHPEQFDMGLNYADVGVIATLDGSGILSGSWSSPNAGTQGFFNAKRSTPAAAAAARNVFVVHGHNHGSRDSVARALKTLGLTPIILDEQPNAGKTTIEKLEHFSAVEFAVVLLTGDDEGCVRSQKDALKPRARQNVILELGYFLGKLGRTGVCALYEAGVEMPSDYHGVVFTPLNEKSNWKRQLAVELKQRWPDLDLNRFGGQDTATSTSK